MPYPAMSLTRNFTIGNPNEPTAAEVEAAKTSAVNERRSQTIERARVLTQKAEGGTDNQKR